MCRRGILVGGLGVWKGEGGESVFRSIVLLEEEWRLMFNFRSVETHVWNGLNLRTNACGLGQVRPLVQLTPLTFLTSFPPPFFGVVGFFPFFFCLFQFLGLEESMNPPPQQCFGRRGFVFFDAELHGTFCGSRNGSSTVLWRCWSRSKFFRHPVGNEPIEALASFPL